jgi:hypothetical protein
MMHESDIRRIHVNDNRPYPYDDEEGVSAFLRETHESVKRWVGYFCIAVAVFGMMYFAVQMGRG